MSASSQQRHLDPQTLPECSHRIEHHPNYGSVPSTTEEEIPQPKRSIGVFSAVFLIFNRVIGTGIFATPSTILRFSGSVGLSLTMWIIGAIIAGTGMQVYIIWGSALPQNGGEKNYLEYIFPRPRRLVTSAYASAAVLLAYAAGNAIVFAEYTLASLYPSALLQSADSPFSPVRLLAFLCLTAAFLLHGLYLHTGLRIQNTLGLFNIITLVATVTTGYMALNGNLQEGIPKPDNFASWSTVWEGSRGGGTTVCACLYNVVYSYIGFSNANYALSEMRDPARTLGIAGPLAIATVTVFYLLCNVAYFAAATREEITNSGRLVAALLFRNVWGVSAESVLSSLVAIAALGNVLSVSFSQGRVNQALGQEGILPFSKFWSSDWPAQAPLAGLGLHWLVCSMVVFGVSQGDAYNFSINVVSYPIAVWNAVISFGLLYLAFRPRHKQIQNQLYKATDQSEPLLAQRPMELEASEPEQTAFRLTPSLVFPALFFGVANVFLVVVPFVRPPKGVDQYEYLPYWTHAAGGWGLFGLGVVWWWFRSE